MRFGALVRIQKSWLYTGFAETSKSPQPAIHIKMELEGEYFEVNCEEWKQGIPAHDKKTVSIHIDFFGEQESSRYSEEGERCIGHILLHIVNGSIITKGKKRGEHEKIAGAVIRIYLPISMFSILTSMRDQWKWVEIYTYASDLVSRVDSHEQETVDTFRSLIRTIEFFAPKAVR
ncbi:MAG: hypothetical protein NTW93_07305 [Phycisphaerae bacterium]|nr:hypothetical protein [Phycisphaerae bacterium]